MFSKIRNITLAVAAVVALGAATLITSTGSADARGFGGGGGGGFNRGGGGGMHVGHIGGGNRFGGNFRGPGRGFGHRPGFNKIGHYRPHWCHYRGLHGCGIHVRWHRPFIYGVGAVAATSYAVAPAVGAAAPTCTCLTKQYTPDNLVVFQDVCTKEVASAPVGNTQVQAPQQQ
jgi:hypothetical protein